MKLGRIFANAIARRIAYVIVAAALAWLGLSDAKAQDYSQCNVPNHNNSLCPDLPAARAAADASAQYYCNQLSNCNGIDNRQETWTGTQWQVRTLYRYGTANNGAWGNYKRATQSCVPPQIYNSLSQLCQAPCAGKPSEVFTHSQRIPGGSHGCKNGCQFTVANNGDGTLTRFFGTNANLCNVLPECLAGEYLNVATSLCTPPEAECQANQTKNPVTGICEAKCPAGMHEDADGQCVADENDCPAGQVRAPSGQCLPGEGQCATGEARRENGTCGRDSDGDGVADEDDGDPENDPEEFFAGGDNCSSPPSCSGGVIDCGMARIQWRIDCNTRRNVNITGGACSAIPQCVGENCKAMEYAQLLQQWRSACALEKMADAEAGEGGDNQDLIDLLTDPGSIQPDLGGTSDMPGGGSYTWGDDDEEFEPDTSGMGWGSSCPSPPAISVFGQSISFNLTPLCNWLALAGNLVLILASLASLRIVSGGVA